MKLMPPRQMKGFMCTHPEYSTQWGQPIPEPTEMVGPCEHNQGCLVCGFGWGSAPDPCDGADDRRLVKSTEVVW